MSFFAMYTNLRVFLFYIFLTVVCTTCTEANRGTCLSGENRPNWALLHFKKADDSNPILKPASAQNFFCPIRNETVLWEERNVLNPTALVKDDKVYLIYRAQDQRMTSRLGMAVSEDGLNFEKLPEPIFYPDQDEMRQYEWPGGVEDPRIVESEDGRYILTYTAYDGKIARLCLASSKDLKTWTKHGLVLGEGKHKDTWSKSGAIVTRLVGHRFVAAKIQGKYWMYFGDTDLFMATSEDLINWEVAEDKELEKMISVLQPRPGYFDSRLVEPGPAAFIVNQGIVLIYNARNASNFHGSDLPPLTYAAGQALFDKENPYKLLDRTDSYFIHPDKEYEKVGEVNKVVFVEGLVYFKQKWFLYYGAADSKIAVAVRE